MLAWWDVAIAWRKAEGDVPHGMVESRMKAFAAPLGVTPLTVRRAASALRFAERLEHKGRIASAALLRNVPISFLDRVQRIDRFDPRQTDELLPGLLSGTLSGADVVESEQKVRASAEDAERKARSLTGKSEREDRAPSEGRGGRPTQSDAHRRRMGTPAFVRRVLEALSSPSFPMQGRIVPLDRRRPRPAPPLPLHGFIVEGEGDKSPWHGVRAFAAGLEPMDPGRLKGAIEIGLAVSRVFHTVLLAFEDREEALMMAAMFDDIGPAGVGVASLGHGTELTFELLPARSAEPDLWQLRDRWLPAPL